ncbi:zinc finger CCCH-type with G patch domain-containing protein [Epargyreus clarus]|uniref:zinc finger CCCH-type with G patch domain-containing protein n=1 Tax=Epargyreus clarus TaxID=520877 RepID=UPI003C2D96D0
MEDLQSSISQYNDQLEMVKQALDATEDVNERESLVTLQSELQELINLTKESLQAQAASSKEPDTNDTSENSTGGLDDEYALFMQEMEKSGAYDGDNKDASQDKDVSQNEDSNDSDIEDELASLLGMKCAVYHTHMWGGQPTLHNAMVSSVLPKQDDDQFSDLQVQILYTHPTHAEMLPCPFYLDGECKFTDEQCRYSHGTTVKLSSLQEAIEPDFESLKVGSRVLLKLKPPKDEDISIAKKSTEKYYLWHIGIVRHVDVENKSCLVNLEQGVKSGEKRKSMPDEYHVQFEEIFPLSSKDDEDTSSDDDDDDLSDTEYPEYKTSRVDSDDNQRDLIVEKSFQNNVPALGEWEKHTRGIGSKIMLAMGYVPGAGLGAAGAGRVLPVPAGGARGARSLDQCMAISEKLAARDPLKVEQKLKRLQKKEEERHLRAYEREKEREKRNVFNFLNKTLGGKSDKLIPSANSSSVDIKQSSSKDLNIEQFKTAEESKRIEVEILKLNSSLAKYPSGTSGHRSITQQLSEKNQELNALRQKEQHIAKEQKQRKDKQKMTVF